MKINKKKNNIKVAAMDPTFIRVISMRKPDSDVKAQDEAHPNPLLIVTGLYT